MSHAMAVAILPLLTLLFAEPAKQQGPAFGAHPITHAAAVALLPMLTLLAGVLSLYVNPEKQPKARLIFLLLLFITGGATIYGSVKDDQDKSKAVADQIDQLSTIKKLSKQSDSIIAILQSRGFDINNVIQTSDSADKALALVKPAVLQEGSSSSVTVVYYPKDVDGPVVVNALKDGGFQVDTHAGKPGNATFATNSIWVGNGVSADQAKFVALTLVRAGVKITSIRRFLQGDGAKSNLIEVGTDKKLLDAPPLTVENISTLKDIPVRDQAGSGLVM